MTDIATAPEQDQIAESLLGEPEEQATTQDPGAEEVVEGSEELETEVDPEAHELAEDETADDWLPTEQQKVFPDDVVRQYAEKRYPDILRLLDNDPTNGVLRQLLHDKLNTDIFLRAQQQQQDEFQQEEFETEQQQEPTQQQTQPQITREQYFQNLDRVIAERTDPEVAKAFHSDFLRAFGVPEAEIAKVPPQQAMQFTSVASKYMLNLMNTFAGDLIQSQLSTQLGAAFPGFTEMYERSAYAMAWDRVRNSNQQFSSLPAYGTKEFAQTLREAESRFPELVNAFEGPDGKIPVAKAGQAYALLAKIASGQAVDPRLVQQAAQAGARNAQRAAHRRSAANLGSGRSTAATQRGSSKFQSNADLFDDDTMNLYQKEHGRL